MPHPKRRVVNKCKICDNTFEVQLSSKLKKVTCSKECSSKNKTLNFKGKKHNIKNRFNNCVRCKSSFLLNGLTPKRKEAKYCSKKCQNDDHSERISGDKSTNWKGGMTNTNSRHLFKREINQWRQKVFKRDFYKCVKCNSKKNLEAHHIVYWSKSVEHRFLLDNGMTLCIDCHGKEHNTTFSVRKKYHCIDCDKEVSRQAKRCVICYKKSKLNNTKINYIQSL